VDPPPPAPEGWEEMEAVGEMPSGGPMVGLMQYGRTDFHGWGGLQVAGAGEARLSLVMETAGPTAETFLLRGVVESGKWFASAGGDEQQLTSPAGGKKPSEWSLPLGEAFAPPGVVTLTVRGDARNGSLLLDAWRLR
ncbi:MAG: hypothetical protein J7M38_04570, partial [Armatimonadetes bacterium]|nr:hypothetical protein [Armatimonadota bacterium]